MLIKGNKMQGRMPGIRRTDGRLHHCSRGATSNSTAHKKVSCPTVLVRTKCVAAVAFAFWYVVQSAELSNSGKRGPGDFCCRPTSVCLVLHWSEIFRLLCLGCSTWHTSSSLGPSVSIIGGLPLSFTSDPDPEKKLSKKGEGRGELFEGKERERERVKHQKCENIAMLIGGIL